MRCCLPPVELADVEISVVAVGRIEAGGESAVEGGGEPLAVDVTVAIEAATVIQGRGVGGATDHEKVTVVANVDIGLALLVVGVLNAPEDGRVGRRSASGSAACSSISSAAGAPGDSEGHSHRLSRDELSVALSAEENRAVAPENLDAHDEISRRDLVDGKGFALGSGKIESCPRMHALSSLGVQNVYNECVRCARLLVEARNGCRVEGQ